jgi:hypothetical protein
LCGVSYSPDAFTVAPEPAAHVAQLLALDPFAHLSRHTIGCLFCRRPLTDRGAAARGIVCVPAQLSGKSHERQLLEWCYAELFREQLAGELPDFVITFDYALWQLDSAVEREQLCYHELAHIQQRRDKWHAPQYEKSGRPALHLVPHDVEVFHSELQRYGAIVPAFDATAASITIGARSAAGSSRRLRRA